MRNANSLLAVITMLVMTACSGCSGLTARQETLLPAIRMAWENVNKDVEAGVEKSIQLLRLDAEAGATQRVDLARLSEGIAAGNAVTIASVSWPPLRESAEFGLELRVSEGEISAGVAGSLRERLSNFGASLQSFLERR